ncbi:hypothetical protein CB1_001428026 [Camelus ferus]|nr:hypothetical protein CB1_001428026 [Camelus ferus]
MLLERLTPLLLCGHLPVRGARTFTTDRRSGALNQAPGSWRFHGSTRAHPHLAAPPLCTTFVDNRRSRGSWMDRVSVCTDALHSAAALCSLFMETCQLAQSEAPPGLLCMDDDKHKLRTEWQPQSSARAGVKLKPELYLLPQKTQVLGS